MRAYHFAAPALLLAAVLSGCQRAERYGPRTGRETSSKQTAEDDASDLARSYPLSPEIQWIDVDNPPRPDVRIEFVHAEKEPEAWRKLTKFWNAPPLTKPGEAAGVVAMPPLTAGAIVGSASSGTIQIKVPLGLPDPRDYIPAGETLTLGKWKLGRQLFFDDTWLEAKTGTSCATCHRPDHGFADQERTHGDGFHSPSLLNCVFNRWQFWDGRAVLLEEVVQRTLEDERQSNPPKPFRHIWSGVIHRLRNKASYHEQFNNVFGTPVGEENGAEKANITQDTVARALASYLRTLLAGDSIHDRAVEQARKGGSDLKAEHYEAVLDDTDLAELDRTKSKKSDVAAELMRGYRLFHGREKNRALVNCHRCHSGPIFTDNGFHNLGIGYLSRPGQEGGRFAQVPIGRKDRYLIDAYKTPSLRNLPRTGPYFHNGSLDRLREVVEFYNHGANANEHLDPELRGEDGQTRILELSAAEIDALVLFLKALNGREESALFQEPSRARSAAE
ncbi:MAG TPA: cytochrome c peroxidase [Gemmataceae bacterium]|nr:cytochrome c peroxidase [Gemmataceae bacterium]